MNIESLHLDGYGVWTGLEIDGLSDGLHVFFGRNEAGKTTMLQFIRTALYGFSPARRRYLPPLHGGTPGGRIMLDTPRGRFTVTRHLLAGRGGTATEDIAVATSDGRPRDPRLLDELLTGLDESVFQNLFAVGLREMQELGTLDDSQAAELLYSLSIGTARVSLVDVMRRVRQERVELLGEDSDERPGLLRSLFDQRDQLRAEVGQLADATPRYLALRARMRELDGKTSRLQREQSQLEQQARLVELAITVRQRWRQRLDLKREVALLSPSHPVPADAIERLDRLIGKQREHEQSRRECLQGRRTARDEAATLPVDMKLWRMAAPIEAIGEHEPWIKRLQEDLRRLQAQADSLDATIARERLTLGLPADDEAPSGSAAAGENRQESTSESRAAEDAGSVHHPMVPPSAGDATLQGARRPTGPAGRSAAGILKRLREPARAMRARRAELEEARSSVDAAERHLADVRRRITERFAGRTDAEVIDAVDQSGEQVSRLRRRIQIDERLDELSRYQSELEEQSRDLIDKQILPMWVLMALGGCLVLGLLLVMAGLFLPGTITGSFGWAMAVLGGGGVGVALATKALLERSNERHLDACQKQIAMLHTQIEQATEERDALDSQLSRGGGPLAARLQAAEQELAELEVLVPLKTEREVAEQKLDSARRRAAEAEGDLAAARRHWSQSLERLGLPSGLSPRQVKRVVGGLGELEDVLRRRGLLGDEIDARRRELEMLTARIRQLAEQADLDAGGDPLTMLATMADTLDRQRQRMERQRELRRRSRELRRRQHRHEDAIRAIKQRRRALLLEANAPSEDELRQRALQAARADVLRNQIESLTREITAAREGICTEEELAEQLGPELGSRDGAADQPGATSEDGAAALPGQTAGAQPFPPLEHQRDDLLGRLEQIEQQLRERFEERGSVAEQARALAEDRQLQRKRLESATVEQQLAEAVRRAGVLSLAARALERIRATYERERQPETLREASVYLERLTAGRYTRVWTPLGEPSLRVDDCDGNPLPVEMLSRGTREQLFLALRLGLAACYGRRGVRLPLVLDDVLVNFDDQRAKAAAAVLRDFSLAGHQVLVFTCHEHIAGFFRALNVLTAELPSSREPNPPAIRFRPRPSEKRSPGRTARLKSHGEPTPAEWVTQRRAAGKAEKRREQPKLEPAASPKAKAASDRQTVDSSKEQRSRMDAAHPTPPEPKLPPSAPPSRPALEEPRPIFPPTDAVFDADFFSTEEEYMALDGPLFDDSRDASEDTEASQSNPTGDEGPPLEASQPTPAETETPPVDSFENPLAVERHAEASNEPPGLQEPGDEVSDDVDGRPEEEDWEEDNWKDEQWEEDEADDEADDEDDDEDDDEFEPEDELADEDELDEEEEWDEEEEEDDGLEDDQDDDELADDEEWEWVEEDDDPDAELEDDADEFDIEDEYEEDDEDEADEDDAWDDEEELDEDDDLDDEVVDEDEADDHGDDDDPNRSIDAA